ncbi:MAG: transcription elongation factor GreB [Gammaproteobacteria bacterium]|nr:transcription elongation factor GreB [Gammaproteobacteria bacterium]
MTRHRPPAARSSLYITRQGFDRLQHELQALWLRRADVTRAVTAAAAEGDRSENAEYIYRKKELREIDRRIRYLQQRLPDLKIVDTVPDNLQQVFFGAWVTIEDDQGAACRYRIVGPDEFDVAHHLISMDSPLARALLKQRLDDQVIVPTPDGDKRYLITDIRYDS